MEIMTIKYISEKSKPSQNSIQLIKQILRDIRADKSELVSLYDHYAEEHFYRLAYDVDYLHTYVAKGSSILECGSTPPLFTAAVSKLSYNIIGIDVSPERFQNSIETLNLDVRKVNFETEALPFDSNSFDAVIFNEIFEHLRINPINTMNSIFRVLKPNGTLLLSTPNLSSIANIFSILFKNKAQSSIYDEYNKLTYLGHMGHVREYTSSEVCSFLNKLGFDVNEVIYRGSYHTNLKLKGFVANMICKLFIRFRPFFSIIAKKPI